jgi:hypothetical protein
VFGVPDEEAVRRLLVDGHGFSDDRVAAAVHRAQKVRPSAPSASATPKGRQASLDGFGTEERS